jgi:hypothetical protein
LPATLTRFGNRFSNLLGPLTCEPFGLPGAGSVRLLQNHLHDHWQRNLHACSDGTFSHFVPGINEKSQARCANPVDDGTSLWKGMEKEEEIELDAQILNPATRDCMHLRVLVHMLRCISVLKPGLDRVLCRPLKRTPVVNMPVPALTCWASYVPPLRAAGHRSRSFRNEQKSAEQRCKNCGSHHD